MTESLYILGGAGTGKSTFMRQVLQGYADTPLGELEALHAKKNAAGATVVLRGHRFFHLGAETKECLYLGLDRPEFPGSDGLDRVSGLPGEEWLRTSKLPDVIISEGSTLSTRRFLTALAETTELYLLLLEPPEFVTELWCSERGSNQDPTFVSASATRARNAFDFMKDHSLEAWERIDSSDSEAWGRTLGRVLSHLSR